ncbi:MAG: hypothetical protein II644_00685 [Paludibacteraceae bacterium]|nr:hypothetical protein [Paludibacteraceae bacterium]
MRNRIYLFILALCSLFLVPNKAQASDWVLNESKYYASDKTDHIKLEVFLCDLDGSNTYCDGGTVIATNGSKSYELVYLKYHDEASDGAASENVTTQLKMHNSKAYMTNATYGTREITTSEQTFQVNKWASDHAYMTAEIDFYYPSELAGDTWKIYFHFKHSDGKWYNMTLRNSIYINNHLGLSDYNAAGYKVERTGIDKITFTVPKLPNDIDSKYSSIRMRKATYDVRYTFYKQDGSTVVVNKSYEAGSSEKTEDCSFPDGVGNPKRIDCRVAATHGIKDPDNWFNRKIRTDEKSNVFPVVPVPNAITTDFRQFDHQTVLSWTTPSSNSYYAVTPYVYRIETDENGTPKSGKSWSKRGNLNSTNGDALSFTDDDVTIGTYFKYMAVNVPTDWINKGINESSLTNPTDDLLAKLGCSMSGVVNTAPSVTIFDLQQDTTVTDKVRLTWQYTRVPTNDATVSFKVLRKTSENGEWSEIGSVNGDAKPAAGATLSFEDADLPNAVVRYQYKIRLEVSGYRFESYAPTAGLLAGTMLKNFTATKGTHDGSVTLTWKAHQAGTDNSNYIISRRYVNSTSEFMQIHSTNGADENYTYEDNTVKPGYYYEYKIEVYVAGVLQNTLYTVGFCQSRGTVAGRVNFGSGTAVQDVRLWLRPSDTEDGNAVKTSSQYVHDASEGIAWEAEAEELAKIFGADKDYTVQLFVRPDAGLSAGAVLGEIPGAGRLTLDNATADGYELRTTGLAEKIIDLASLTGNYTAQDKDILTGTLGGNYKISIADGATVVLRDATINGTHGINYQWAGITCKGDATIVLEGENRVKGFMDEYPGILIPKDKTLTIRGLGSLTALTSNGWGSAGIGGGYQIPCGNIVIEGGIITATGGEHATGVGGGRNTSCGTITITGGKVTATGGEGVAAIGRGTYGSCGTITIGGTVLWDGSNYQNGGESILALNSYTYDEGDDWMSQQTPYETVLHTGAFLPTGKYSLLTISKTGNQLSIQVDSSEVKTITIPALEITSPFSLGGASGVTSAQAFKGNFAEVRVFDHVLSDAEKKSYYDRVLNGRESGLLLYWPLDEGLERYAFDASYSNDLPNGRHATIGANISPSAIVPAEKQLARYGVTNDKGEYLIRGIPFLGSGSSYTLVPEKGIHEFDPKNRSLFISPSSLTVNNVDFEDVSSFPMTGHIYYAGTNIPAEGIQFYVDGVAVTANGKPQQTDANGYYNISVPIGEHFVEAKLEGHCLVDSGRFPIEGTFDFVDRVQYDFIDSTLVNFVGRVAGAKYNDTIPVGFGESKNNIGVATITLRLNNESFSFNCKNDYITPAETDRYYESDTVSINSHAWTGSGAVANTKYIYINTDSATGEFSAKLPPLKYIMKSIVIGSNDEIEFGSLPEIDLTNPKLELSDSIRRETAQGDTVVNLYKYNTKKVFTYYAQPQVDVSEKGHPAGAFGLDSLIIPIDDSHNDTVRNVYTVNEQGAVSYLFGYPIYQSMGITEYEVHAYESYINKDYATPVIDTVHLSGQELIIGNEMSADQDVIYDAPDTSHYAAGEIYQMKNHVLTLDTKGSARLPWSVGLPNIALPYTRQFNITLKRDDRTYEPFRMSTIVLGALTTGNNFVTNGPDMVQFILRDPYGAHSKTTLKKGSVSTVTKFYTYQRQGEHLGTVDIFIGSELTTVNGLGVAVVNTNKAHTDFTVGMKSNWKYTHKNDSIYMTTTVESISTGDHYPYIGANGDVYVGTSTNILIGMCRKLHAQKNVTTNKYEIVLDDALAMGEQVKTMFAYSQYELVNVMIPKWKDQRRQYLTRVATQAEAESYVNNGEHAVCLTWLDLKDPLCGDKGTYVYVEPQVQPEQSEIDSVNWCNEQIEKWEARIRENEEAKIKAMNEKTPANYSIDGGSSRSFSYRHDTTSIDQKQTDYTIQAVLGWKSGWKIKSVVRVGLQSNVSTLVGGGTVTGSGRDTTYYTEWDYDLADGNRDVDLSINMYPADKGNNSKIFSLFGGQTYNPYEPADSTHYYKPDGESLPLGNGTVRMEQPYMSIGKGSEAPGKSVTLTDIPSGESATATLYCSNMTNTHQVLPFGYDVSVLENTDTTGLQILMDGVPINGRTIWMDQGTTVKKTITVRQTDESILDHEGVQIRFMSQYQPATIYDDITINAHFKPSSSPVDLTVTNPVINTDPTTGKGKLNLKLSGFNRQFKNLKNIGVQYRFAGNTQWTELYTWETNEADTAGASHTLLPATGDLKLTVDMSNNVSYPEGEYEFRAFTTTPYGNEPVQVFSETTKVIKDMTLPRPLFTPTPANGILGIGDQLAVEFNEDIVPGYVGDKNIIVTAKLNGRPINHEVSYHLVPFGQEVQTVNPLFLNGNFSMEFWLNWHDAGTILHQGSGDGNFSLKLDEAGHVIVSVVGQTFTSTETLPQDKWIFVAMNYKAQSMNFNMLAQYGDETTHLFQEEKVPMESVEIVDYTEDNYLYLGPINANIHHLALYNIYRDVIQAGSEKEEEKDAYTYGLTNYWPMNEGHGHLAADTRRTHDFEVIDSWTLSNTNYALRMDTTTGARADISLINTTQGESYAIEMWYQSSITFLDTLFETDNMRLRFDSTHNLVLDYGAKSKIVVARADFRELTAGWHHVALNVVRGQAASFYFDGKRTAVIAEADVPVLKGATLSLIKGGELTYMDELRIWKATLSEDRLLSNMYNTIDTSDVYARGLIAYYPFEHDSIINGVATKGETLKNMAPKSKTGNAGDVAVANFMMITDTPPLKNAPSETRITAVPVASERQVVINLSEAEVSARDIEGTTLNITLAEIHDLHGNMSNPIKWTAYVRQNTLKWSKDSVNIYKKYGANYTFDVDIKNLSGQIEYYTVVNMPEWLILDGSISSDDVQPLKAKTLRFKVNPLVPVNDYDVTIGLQGNNEILEPLRIVMKVRGETPDWNVDPTLYDHSMTVIGQVFLGGIMMENSESLVAAFIGGECRGVAAPEKVRGAAYVTLPIYGHDVANKDAEKIISFRIWDASRGVAYTDAQITVQGKDTTIVFHDGALLGNFDEPVIWTKSDKVEQLLSIHENWNWIAFGVEPESQYCDVIFKDYSGWGILLKDTGNYIQSNGAQWKGSLVPKVNAMYKMNITRTPATETATLQEQLSIKGQQLPSYQMPVEIAQGWNWIPYTPLTTKRVLVALDGVKPQKGDIIKSQTAVAIYGTNGWEGTLTALEPGHGYLYFSTDSVTKSFIYPEDLYQPNGTMAAPLRAISNQLSALIYFEPVDKHNYPSNMTMTIRLMDGDAIVDTCEIAAFVGDECRGAVRADAEGLYYLVIAGEGAGQAMEIKTVLDGEIVTIDNSLTFVSDNHVGTPWEPYIIQLNPAEGIEEITDDKSQITNTRKIIRDGILYILRNGKTYTATGAEIIVP